MKLLILLVILSLSILSINNIYNNLNTQDNSIETNYIGLVKLGLAPSTYSRQLTEHDIDTGIKLTDGNNIYSLIESRTWITKDYGKTFLIRVD